jgi:hypothetical protein
MYACVSCQDDVGCLGLPGFVGSWGCLGLPGFVPRNIDLMMEAVVAAVITHQRLAVTVHRPRTGLARMKRVAAVCVCVSGL